MSAPVEVVDTFIEKAGQTVQGHGPGVSCKDCRRNSLLCGVYFWGYRREGRHTVYSVAKAADVTEWTCPPCATRNTPGGEIKGTRFERVAA